MLAEHPVKQLARPTRLPPVRGGLEPFLLEEPEPQVGVVGDQDQADGAEDTHPQQCTYQHCHDAGDYLMHFWLVGRRALQPVPGIDDCIDDDPCCDADPIDYLFGPAQLLLLGLHEGLL